MSWLAWIRPDPPAPPPPPAPDRARDRRDALAEAAIALARADRDGDVDPLLRLIVEAAHRIAGGGAALLLLGRDGGLERFAGEGLDGCTRETLARPDLLRAL
ncbi:MAG TPA: hypothetical protein VJ814_01110, partial [Gaiellaceae bacterium]|nr:hypothetical protein [Gaiellaceae bacterium]